MKAFFSAAQKEQYGICNSRLPNDKKQREIFWCVNGEIKEVTEVGEASTWTDAVELGEAESFSHLGKVISNLEKSADKPIFQIIPEVLSGVRKKFEMRISDPESDQQKELI